MAVETAVALRQNTHAIATESPTSHWSDEQIGVLKRTLAKGASDDEFFMFASLAARYQLDPFNKEIWFIKYGSTPQIITSRDGYLKICQRDPEFLGINSAAIRQNDEFEFDPGVGTVRHRFGKGNRGAIIGAWAIAKHKRRDPVICYAEFSEYNNPKSDIWRNYPSAMICKVAEAMALKRQGGISGLVAQEELKTESPAGDGENTFQPQAIAEGSAAPQALPQARDAAPVSAQAGDVDLTLLRKQIWEAARKRLKSDTLTLKWFALEYPRAADAPQELDERELREGLAVIGSKMPLNPAISRLRGEYREARAELEARGMTGGTPLSGEETEDYLGERLAVMQDLLRDHERAAAGAEDKPLPWTEFTPEAAETTETVDPETGEVTEAPVEAAEEPQDPFADTEATQAEGDRRKALLGSITALEERCFGKEKDPRTAWTNYRKLQGITKNLSLLPEAKLESYLAQLKEYEKS